MTGMNTLVSAVPANMVEHKSVSEHQYENTQSVRNSVGEQQRRQDNRNNSRDFMKENVSRISMYQEKY